MSQHTFSMGATAQPLYVMAKPVSACCNLGCDYCYYLEKKKLYPTLAPYGMNDETLEKYIAEYIHLQPRPEVLFIWHGGEPLLRGLLFFRKSCVFKKSMDTDGKLITVCKRMARCLPMSGAGFSRQTIF